MNMLSHESVGNASVIPPVEQLPVSNNRAFRRLGASATAVALVLPLAACGESEASYNGLIPLPDISTSQPPIEPALPTFENTEAVFTFDLEPEIIQIEPPLPNPEGDRQIEPKGIILHWWAADGNGDIEVLRRGLAGNKACGPTGCSSQYGITRSTEEKDAQIYRMTQSATVFTEHAKGGNDTTFGIEIEGNPEHFKLGGPEFDQAKFEKVVSLVLELVEDFDLPVEGPAECGNVQGIHGHHELDHCSGSGKKDVGDEYTRAVIAAVKYVHERQAEMANAAAIPTTVG